MHLSSGSSWFLLVCILALQLIHVCLKLGIWHDMLPLPLLLPALLLRCTTCRCRSATTASHKARQVDWLPQRQLPASGAATPLALLQLLVLPARHKRQLCSRRLLLLLPATGGCQRCAVWVPHMRPRHPQLVPQKLEGSSRQVICRRQHQAEHLRKELGLQLKPAKHGAVSCTHHQHQRQ
jgi:hypothetical protein